MTDRHETLAQHALRKHGLAEHPRFFELAEYLATCLAEAEERGRQEAHAEIVAGHADPTGFRRRQQSGKQTSPLCMVRIEMGDRYEDVAILNADKAVADIALWGDVVLNLNSKLRDVIASAKWDAENPA